MHDTESAAQSGGGGSAPGRITLVVPPFQSLSAPALGVSLLKACLAQRGFDVEILYLNLRFAEMITLPVWAAFKSAEPTALLGEHVFSHALFERSETDVDAYLGEPSRAEETARILGPEEPRKDLLKIIAKARELCNDVGPEKILANDPWLVGFTSTFQQNCAALALAAAVKRRRPGTLVVMGGANCEGAMGEELFARFPQLDFLAQGECDHSFPQLVEALADGRDGDGIPGVLGRASSAHQPSVRLSGAELDALPYPSYDDFFYQLGCTSLADLLQPRLLLEASRGCWWGAKHRCKFCAYNGQGAGYRSKPPDRVASELEAMVSRYGVREVLFTDLNLNTGFFQNFLPRLAEAPPASLFFATTANLKREQVRMLANAGVRWIQPGIESLSDRSLELMGKGTTHLKNIQVLKWCSEDGVRVTWSHLAGFPGEAADEIRTLATCTEALHHLEPPDRAVIIDLLRFSPYFEDPEHYGLQPVRAVPAYEQVYPFDAGSVDRLAYYFESPHLVAAKHSDAFRFLKEAVAAWRRAHANAHLLAIRLGRTLWLLDTRPCAQRRLRLLYGSRQRVYELCDRARSIPGIMKDLTAEGTAMSQTELEAILASFVEARLTICAGGRHLALATQAGARYRDSARSAGGRSAAPRQAVSMSSPRIGRTAGWRQGPRQVLQKIRVRLGAACTRMAVHAASSLTRPDASE